MSEKLVDQFRDNEANWDDRARVHALSDMYDVAGFVGAPLRIEDTVQQDRHQLGSLVGKDVVHLQCHIGLDTLSLARLGAKTVVGIDLSGESVRIAQQAAQDANLSATFVKSNVYDAVEALEEAGFTSGFDVVYTGVGALWWIPNIARWAQVVSQLLRPGGVLVLRDDHPLAESLSDDVSDGLKIEYSYFEEDVALTYEDSGTYSDIASDAPPITNMRNHGWNHSLGQILVALTRTGLVVEQFSELEAAAWERFPGSMHKRADGFHLNEGFPRIPLSFSLTARKPGQDGIWSGLFGSRGKNTLKMEDVAPAYRSPLLLAPHVDITAPIVRSVSRMAPRILPTVAPAPLVPGRIPGVRIEHRHADVPIRLYLPPQPNGAAMLWIHGGGMVMGAPPQDDTLCSQFAADGLVVASADYRLAPEHPFPIPQDDVFAAWQWLCENAEELGVSPDRLAVAGASAGGGLAASLVNRLRTTDGPQVKAQWLLYPMLDDRTAANKKLDSIRHFVWDNADNRHGWTALLRGTAKPGGKQVPALAAPAREADLTGLPPTWIGIGDIDLFYQEDLDYATRLRQAGVDVTFQPVHGAPHTFESLGAEDPQTIDYMKKAREWLVAHTQ